MNILIIRFSSLGDVIMTTAVVEILKQKFSESRIYFLTKSEYSQVFKYDKRIHKVIEIQGNENPFKIVKKSGRGKFDIIIDLHSSLRSIAVSSLFKSPQKLRVNKHSLARRFMILSRNRFKRKFDVLGNYIETLNPLVRNKKVLPKIIPNENVIESKLINDLYNISNSGFRKRIIGIAPGGSHLTKMWNGKSFAELADIIIARGDKAVFIGDESDIKIVDGIRETMNNDALSLAGEIDLSTTIELISHLDGLVTNDSGPMHLAGALNIPFVAIFGPTHPDLGFCPGYSSGKIIHSGAECSPCSLHGSLPCRKEQRFCMDDITHEEVLVAIDKITEN